MAQRVVVTKTDDIDGAVADETVTFAVDGVAYEIDVTSAHAAQLRAAFAPFVEAGRRVGAGRRSGGQAGKATAGYDPKAVRAWAASNHIQIPARGRIPAAVVAQYRAAGF